MDNLISEIENLINDVKTTSTNLNVVDFPTFTNQLLTRLESIKSNVQNSIENFESSQQQMSMEQRNQNIGTNTKGALGGSMVSMTKINVTGRDKLFYEWFKSK